MEIPKELNNEIWDYCRANSIVAIDDFIIKLIKQGFTIEKFGATPQPREKVVEKIVEKVVEVPVEKIIEKFIEVPVTVENEEVNNSLKSKILEVETLNSKVNELNQKVDSLGKELEIEKNKNKKDIYGER